MSLSSSIRRGILSLPGADAASKAAAERLLREDFATHHCFFHQIGFHNHLSHHILTAYDLGASASLLQAIFDDEAKIQRPIDLKVNGVVPEGLVRPGEIREDNWTKWLGEPKAYSAYVAFFSDRIATLGIAKTLEDYVFSPIANGNNSNMLYRLIGGLLHPFIQVGFGLEFDSEIEIASGLAQMAVHGSQDAPWISPGEFTDVASPGSFSVDDDHRQPRTGPSILSLLRQIYDSPELVPVLPYDPDAFFTKRIADMVKHNGGRLYTKLTRIICQFDPGETKEDFDGCMEELVFASTLLAFGTGKRDRKPRVDFFLMHLLTSTLSLPSFFKYVTKVEYKKALFRILLQAWGVALMIRGRPRIDPVLIMSYTDHPVPPNAPVSADPSSIDGKNPESVNPWPAIIADNIHAPDAHTIKSLRTLLYGAINYGTLPKGRLIGTFDAEGKETHPGIAGVDGTIFVRAAGILMDALGWVTHGQKAGAWDRSALGWDDAWKNED